MRELALPIAQFFGEPQVDRALEALGMPELPIPHISLLELLDAANGVFEFSRLENGDVSVVYCSQGSPMTSAFKVEAVIHRAGLDFKVLRTDYGGAYDTVGAGEIDLSDGLHFAIEDYGFGAFLYLDASAGEMSDTRQAFDARAAYKLETYDDPTSCCCTSKTRSTRRPAPRAPTRRFARSRPNPRPRLRSKSTIRLRNRARREGAGRFRAALLLLYCGFSVSLLDTARDRFYNYKNIRVFTKDNTKGE